MPPPANLIIRALRPDDAPAWRLLWTDYLAFYKTTLPDTVYDSTFERLLGDAPYDPNALVADQGGKLVGLVHYLFHRHCWRLENVCYLQDLYVVPADRGTGVGRELITAVYAAADDAGCPSVYWMTQTDNVVGRRLYDRIGTLTEFLKYQRRA